MEEMTFTPKESLNEYFDKKYEILDRRFQESEEGTVFVFPMGDFNRELFEKLSMNKKWKEAFNPLEFFKVLYSQLNLIATEEDEEFFLVSFFNKIEKLSLTQVQYGFLVYSLTYITGQFVSPLDFREYTLENNPKKRPLQDLHTHLFWELEIIRGEIGNNILPENFDRTKNILESKQIALIYVYNGKKITRDNGSAVAAEYHRRKKTSGDELYCDYLTLIKTIDRVGDPGTLRKLKNNIKLIKSILDYLVESGKQSALDDLQVLESLKKKYYQ